MTLCDLLSIADDDTGDIIITVYLENENTPIWWGWLTEWREFQAGQPLSKLPVVMWVVTFNGGLAVYVKQKEFKKIPTKLKKIFGGFAKFPYLCP